MGLALGEGRAAQLADGLGKRLVADRRHLQPVRQGFGTVRRGRIAHHDARVVHTPHSDPLEQAVEVRRLAEGRDAHQHRQLGLVEHLLAQREFSLQRQPSGAQRIDAAGALCLAGREAHQPAIDDPLLRRCAGIQAGLLDSGQQVGTEVGRHESHSLGVFGTAMVPAPLWCPIRSTISCAKSMNACAPFDAGSNTTPGMP